MRNIFIYFATLCLLISCKRNEQEDFSAILKDNFLYFSDTIAYKYHTFFVTPNVTIDSLSLNADKIEICINEKLANSDKLKLYLRNKLMITSDTFYLPILDKRIASNLSFIKVGDIENIGRYTLSTIKNCGNQASTVTVGTLEFYQPIIDKDRAIIFLSKQSSSKAGVINSYLLKKNNDKWVIEKVVELERW